MSKLLVLDGHSLTLDSIAAFERDHSRVTLSENAIARMALSR